MHFVCSSHILHSVLLKENGFRLVKIAMTVLLYTLSAAQHTLYKNVPQEIR